MWATPRPRRNPFAACSVSAVLAARTCIRAVRPLTVVCFGPETQVRFVKLCRLMRPRKSPGPLPDTLSQKPQVPGANERQPGPVAEGRWARRARGGAPWGRGGSRPSGPSPQSTISGGYQRTRPSWRRSERLLPVRETDGGQSTPGLGNWLNKGNVVEKARESPRRSLFNRRVSARAKRPQICINARRLGAASPGRGRGPRGAFRLANPTVWVI